MDVSVNACVHVCVYMCMCMCVYLYKIQVNFGWPLPGLKLDGRAKQAAQQALGTLLSPFPCICHHAWPWRQFLWTDIRSSCLHDKHFSDWVIPPVPCSHFQSFYIIYSFLIILSVLVLPKPYSESRPKLKHPLSFTCQICISFPFLTGAVFQAESSWGMLTTSWDEAPALG